MSKLEFTLRRFEAPDEVRRFPRSRLELVRIGGLTIGRARITLDRIRRCDYIVITPFGGRS